MPWSGVDAGMSLRVHSPSRSIQSTGPRQNHDRKFKPVAFSQIQTAADSEYMVRLRAQAGVYLVGWFDADKWDPADGRRKTVPKMSVDDVRAKLEGQAAVLPEGIIVRPVVVECRTPA